MSYPRQFGHHDSACLASRDTFERIPEPGALKRSPVLSLMLTNDLYEVQFAPLTLRGDLQRLSSQLQVGALVMLFLHGRVSEYKRSADGSDLVRRRRVSPRDSLTD